MQSYVITPKNSVEEQQLAQFLRHSHLPAKVLSDEEKEDLGMLMLLAEVDRNDTVGEEEIRKILDS